MSNEIKCPHCGEAFTVDESGYAAILNQVRDQEFQREVDARVSLAEKSREQEVALAVSKAEEALRAQIAERDGELVNLKAQLSAKESEAEAARKLAVSDAMAAEAERLRAVERERDELAQKLESQRAQASMETQIAVQRAEAAAKGGSESKPYDYTVNCNGHEVFFHANTYFHDEGHQKGALVIGDAVQAEGAEIFFETPCVQLLVEDGRVAGAIGETKDGAHVLLRANKGVIMAAGDYVGDSEMLYYYTPDAKGLHQAVDFRNGTGLKAAMWAGAQMCPASHTKMVHGEGPKVRFEMPYLFLDRHGKRFMDEGCCRMGYLNEFTNKYLAEVDFAESTAAKFFSIVPTNWEEHYDAWKDFSDISIHNAYRNVDPEAWIKGDTLEELAEGMIAYADEEGWAHDYTVEAIVESINRYNELVAAGNGDEDFGKRDEYMVPIEAPCYAVPRGANNIDALVDGLWCDGNFQCLDVDMKPIEGLFAVGNASGPFFGNSNYPMDIEGLSVGRAITTGFATGRYVAGL